jgi:hypothetical protein
VGGASAGAALDPVCQLGLRLGGIIIVERRLVNIMMDCREDARFQSVDEQQ